MYQRMQSRVQYQRNHQTSDNTGSVDIDLHLLFDRVSFVQLYGGRKYAINEASTSASIGKILGSIQDCDILSETQIRFSGVGALGLAIRAVQQLISEFSIYNESHNLPLPLKALVLESQTCYSPWFQPQCHGFSNYGRTPLLLMTTGLSYLINESQDVRVRNFHSCYLPTTIELEAQGSTIRMVRLLDKRETVHTNFKTSRLTFMEGTYYGALIRTPYPLSLSDFNFQDSPVLIRLMVKSQHSDSLTPVPRSQDLLVIDQKPISLLDANISQEFSTFDCCYQLTQSKKDGTIWGCQRLIQLHFGDRRPNSRILTSDFFNRCCDNLQLEIEPKYGRIISRTLNIGGLPIVVHIDGEEVTNTPEVNSTVPTSEVRRTTEPENGPNISTIEARLNNLESNSGTMLELLNSIVTRLDSGVLDTIPRIVPPMENEEEATITAINSTISI